MKKTLGIYIHIPFCVRKCNYCDFCSFPSRDGKLTQLYTDELCRRIRGAKELCYEYTVDTVYLGGGTPTLLSAAQAEMIFSALRESFSVEDGCEITVECNPATADISYFSALRGMGASRLSMGLQSVHENELRALGRIHSYSDLKKTYADARAAGFDNISVDLMYGIPEQTVKSFRESLTELACLAPEHISAYGLKIEKGTPFFEKREHINLPDEDEEYEMYLSCTEILKKYGYKKYEISNFSMPERESRHNLKYWRGNEYLGFGVAAHSFFGGLRFGNSRDLDAFLRGEDIVCERSDETAVDELTDFVMLSLRLSEGMSLKEFEEKAKNGIRAVLPQLDSLMSGGFMRIKDGRLSFTDKGFFVSNTILSDILEGIDKFRY